MAKQWFFEVMGEAIGPLTSAELIHRAQKGEVLPDTRVRMGTDGTWQLAARVKGLFGDTKAARRRETPESPQRPQTQPTATAFAHAETDATVPLAAKAALPADAAADITDPLRSPPSQPREYEFYDMVGFEDALGHTLYHAVRDYVRERGLTMTAVNRQALAEFIGRPDLAADQPPQAEATVADQDSATGIA